VPLDAAIAMLALPTLHGQVVSICRATIQMKNEPGVVARLPVAKFYASVEIEIYFFHGTLAVMFSIAVLCCVVDLSPARYPTEACDFGYCN